VTARRAWITPVSQRLGSRYPIVQSPMGWVATPDLVAAAADAGAFVAGLKAGYMYNTFPLMGGRWIPDGLFYLDPAWINLFENPVMVQWIHRLLGVTTLALALGLWIWSLGQPFARPLRWGIAAVALTVAIQAALGITTLLMQVPVLLGTLHQGGAVLVLTAVLAAAHWGRTPGNRAAR
jgi:heme a synthase